MAWGFISINGMGSLIRVDRLVEGEDTINGERDHTLTKVLFTSVSRTEGAKIPFLAR